MADTLVAGIPFPVTTEAAAYFNSMPADKQAEVRALTPVDKQRAWFEYTHLTVTVIGDKTYADTVAHQHQSLGPFDFSHTPLAGPAENVNSAVSAVTTTADFLGKLGQPATWIRIAQAVVGAALVVVALNIVAKPVVAPVAKGLIK